MADDLTMQQRLMAALARSLDEYLNGNLKGEDRQVGFVLLTFPFNAALDQDGAGTMVNYVGNGNRDDIRNAMRAILARWKETPSVGVIVPGGDQRGD